MSITEKMRKVFDACTVMAGVEPDFECVYMTKGVALLYLDEIDAESDRMREERDTYCDLVDCMVHPDVPDQLAADNAKLRELMADMLRYYAMPNEIDYRREADLLERAHEMGVDA